MQRLQSERNVGKHALFLDHRKLINKEYGAIGVAETYELKAQLFQFKAKPIQLSQKPHRKRKHKSNLNEPATNGSGDNIIEYLQLLPKARMEDGAPLPRYWEDEYALPQMHGCNSSGEFQKYQTTKESSRSFLIPHGTTFYNHSVESLGSLLPQLLPSYDLIVLDPPWRNKYIRRLKRAKQELGYAMMDNDQLAMLPIDRLTHERTLVAVWCTNSSLHQRMLEMELLPRWKLRMIHKLRWYKLNTEHKLIHELNPANATQKQPYEMLYLACHAGTDVDYAEGLLKTELLFSVPSIVHSHKPPLLDWLRPHMQLAGNQAEPNCLELFARYLQPHFTSIGLEVLKLMDDRLYDKVGRKELNRFCD